MLHLCGCTFLISFACLSPRRSLVLSEAELRHQGANGSTAQHANLHVRSANISNVHLPADADAPELMISRLRAIDRGRNEFRKRVKREPKPLPAPERRAPIVSANLTEADAFGAQ